MTDGLKRKVERALKILRFHDGAKPLEVCYSGGKDSDCILELVRMSGLPYRAIYKATTIDPPGTVAHCRERGVEVMWPRKTFFQLVRESGFPTRFARFCCSQLKEYKVLDDAVHGIRRAESAKRAARYREPVICRMYGKGEHVNVYLPILDWSNDDVAEFVAERGMRCHPLYYDADGHFHAERRLGCMGCPMKCNAGRDDFKANPRLARAWLRNAAVWFDDPSRHLRSREKFRTVHDLFFNNLFCKSYDDYLLKKRGLFGELDCKAWLEEWLGISLDV